MHGSRYVTNKPEDRFLEKFEIGKPDECWLWGGKIMKRGHGSFRFNGTMGVASRFSYEYFIGKIPDGMFVCHKCDVRSCVNPNHLFIGTAKDNSDDMIAKGRSRHPKGEDIKQSKLTRQQADLIRSSSLSLRKVAEQFGITYGNAGKIRRGELWAD